MLYSYYLSHASNSAREIIQRSVMACETYECTSAMGPYAYPQRLPFPPVAAATPAASTRQLPRPPGAGPAVNVASGSGNGTSRRPTIKLHMPSIPASTTGDYTSYSALSPTHTKTPRTMYRQLAACQSTEVLPSPLRRRAHIPISTSFSNLPLQLLSHANITSDPVNDNDNDSLVPPPPTAKANANGNGKSGLGREPSKLSTLLSSLSVSKAAWKRAEKARLQTIHKQRMSNGTANFYFPPEEQEWDPKAIKRLSKLGSKQA